MVVRWDPFRDLMSIQNELNRLFGRTFAGSEAGEGGSWASGSWVPPLDVYETEDRIVVDLELPGVEPADVDVSVEDSVLTVQGQRKFYAEISEEQMRRVERRFGTFSRSLTLPATADAEKIEARFDKGILTLDIPKREEAKPKRIEIKASA
jgi:HSP20 family protein